MKAFLKSAIALIAVVLQIAGAYAQQAVEAPEFNLGDYWVFQYTDTLTGVTSQYVEEVAKIDGKTASLTRRNTVKLITPHVYQNGVLQSGNGIQMMKFPLVDKEWGGSFTGPSGSGTYTFQVIGEESLAIAGQQFQTVKMLYRSYIGTASVTQTHWYAPLLKRIVQIQSTSQPAGFNYLSKVIAYRVTTSNKVEQGADSSLDNRLIAAK